MEKEERISLFKSAFPFWDRMSAQDQETFLRSSYEKSFKKGIKSLFFN